MSSRSSMAFVIRAFLCITLAIISVAILLFSIGHVIFCQPFFFLLPGQIDGILLLITVFHGICLRVPNRCHLVLQCICTLSAFALAILSVLELICIRKSPALTQTICYGLDRRTGESVQSCNLAMESIQILLMRMAKITRIDDVRKMVSGSLAFLAALQIFICSGRAWNAVLETKLRIVAHHWQILLSIFLIIFGFVHFVYCCTYYYVGFGIFVGIYALFQAGMNWYTNCQGGRVRLVNVVGSALGMALTAANGFGLLCWFGTHSLKYEQFSLAEHCQWRWEQYRYCHRSLHFSTVYIDWPPRLFDFELGFFQLLAYSALFVGGIAQFSLSLRSTFRRPD